MGAAGNKKPKKAKAGKHTPSYEVDSEAPATTVNRANKKAKK